MKRPYGEMKELADEIVVSLAPHCTRIEIAGSIRRRCSVCGDVEVVCIPKTSPVDLFDTEVKGSPAGKYTQRLGDGIKLDLFMVYPNNWGLQFAIRTGSAEFSKGLARRWVQLGYHSVSGVLYRHTQPHYIREERDLFELLGLPWVAPEERDA